MAEENTQNRLRIDQSGSYLRQIQVKDIFFFLVQNTKGSIVFVALQVCLPSQQSACVTVLKMNVEQRVRVGLALSSLCFAAILNIYTNVPECS